MSFIFHSNSLRLVAVLFSSIETERFAVYLINTISVLNVPISSSSFLSLFCRDFASFVQIETNRRCFGLFRYVFEWVRCQGKLFALDYLFFRSIFGIFFAASLKRNIFIECNKTNSRTHSNAGKKNSGKIIGFEWKKNSLEHEFFLISAIHYQT